MKLKKTIIGAILLAQSVYGQMINSSLDYDWLNKDFYFKRNVSGENMGVSFKEKGPREEAVVFSKPVDDYSPGLDYSSNGNSTNQFRTLGLSFENFNVGLSEKTTTNEVTKTFQGSYSNKFGPISVQTSFGPDNRYSSVSSYHLNESDSLGVVLNRTLEGYLEEGLGLRTEQRGIFDNVELQFLKQEVSDKEEQEVSYHLKAKIRDDFPIAAGTRLELYKEINANRAVVYFPYKNLTLEAFIREDLEEKEMNQAYAVSANFLNNNLQFRTYLEKEGNFFSSIQFKKEF